MLLSTGTSECVSAQYIEFVVKDQNVANQAIGGGESDKATTHVTDRDGATGQDSGQGT